MNIFTEYVEVPVISLIVLLIVNLTFYYIAINKPLEKREIKNYKNEILRLQKENEELRKLNDLYKEDNYDLNVLVSELAEKAEVL